MTIAFSQTVMTLVGIAFWVWIILDLIKFFQKRRLIRVKENEADKYFEMKKSFDKVLENLERLNK